MLEQLFNVANAKVADTYVLAQALQCNLDVSYHLIVCFKAAY